MPKPKPASRRATRDEESDDEDASQTRIGEPVRHVMNTWRHAMGEEPVAEISTPTDPGGEKLIAKLVAMARETGTIISLVTASDIRAWLSQLRRTELYKSVTMLAQRVSGRSVPRLSAQLLKDPSA